MYRQALALLSKWRNKPNRKPLVIKGARQVGKTWLMKEFGKTHYKNKVYVNFDSNSRLQELFSGDLNPEKLIFGLEIYTGQKITSKDTLLIFDEIQEVPRALSALKYFCEEAPQYHIVCAGSLLGIALHKGTSFPVGKVDFLNLYPLSFKEFLIALGKDGLVKVLEQGSFDMLKSFKTTYIELLKQYYFIGGMPEAVQSFAEEKDFNEVRMIQKRILEAYEQDFSKHAPNEIVPRLKMLWNSIPAQLAKENKKFIYGLIKEGARAKEYELALSWLIDCGLIYKIDRVNKPNIPLIAYQDTSAFKLYILDVGILGAMTRIDEKILLEGNEIFTEFKGSFTEQFVLTELKSNKDIPIFYWSAEKATAEIDFLIQLYNFYKFLWKQF